MRQRIVDAAIDVFHDRGFAAATVSELVGRSDVGAGSIYHHFRGGKDELFVAILRRVAADNEARIRAT